MSWIPKELWQRIFGRANGRCEYCRLLAKYSFHPHEVDHIYATKHGGKTTEDNLCLSCFRCNRHKGSDVASVDPETDQVIRLYHPRRDQWDDHFVLDGADIIGKTDIGRVTLTLLQINTSKRVDERRLLIKAGLYP